MPSVLTRNIALFGGMILAGFIRARAAPFMHSPRGDAGPTILAAVSPIVATLACAVIMLLATALACLVGRIVNAAIGLFVLGAGLLVLDGRLAGIRALAYANPERSTLFTMALETLLLAAFALGVVLIVFRATGGFHDVEPDEQGVRPHGLVSAAAWRSAACGIFVLPAVWLIAQSPMKGQAIAAVVIGSMIAGLTARLIAPHVQPLLIFVSPLIFGAIGHVIAALTTRGPLDEAYISGGLSVFARVMPMDYLAGSLLGVSMGLGWAKSFLHHEEVAHDAAAAPRRV